MLELSAPEWPTEEGAVFLICDDVLNLSPRSVV